MRKFGEEVVKCPYCDGENLHMKGVTVLWENEPSAKQGDSDE